MASAGLVSVGDVPEEPSPGIFGYGRHPLLQQNYDPDLFRLRLSHAYVVYLRNRALVPALDHGMLQVS